MTRVTIQGRSTDLARMGRAWVEIFPTAGEYWVEPVRKAQLEGTNFDEWFLEALSRQTSMAFTSLRDAMWELLDKWIAERGYRPSEAEWWELEQALFDLSRGGTAHMVGLSLPPDVQARLRAMGAEPAEVLDFPALAYRMGALYEQLLSTEPAPWENLVALARRFPLAPAENAAVEVIRRRAGLYLKPLFDEAGRIWTAEREIQPLRHVLAEAMQQRQHPREVARALGAAARAQGNLRDMDRVARTEIANARSHGAWNVESGQWGPDTMLFRHTSKMACDDCLRLYKADNGMPKLYTRAQLEAFDAMGPNRGPREEWLPKVGATHPNCNCSPWQRWYQQLAPVFAPGAKAFADRLAEAA